MRKTLVALIALALPLAACGGDDDDDAAEPAATEEDAGGDLSGSINIFAASSLTDAFTELGEQFTAANPDSNVEFNFGASSDLVTQIDEGAPADVFASADEANMQKIVDAGANGGEPVNFAKNRLAIAVEPGNPLGIGSLEDLANPDVKVVLCASEVPCGKYADQILDEAGVDVTPVSREANVRDALGKIGEADAAIVYVTDVQSTDTVEGISIPDDQNVIATLPVVALKESGNSELATAFAEYVASDEARAILTEEFGFLAP